MSDKPSIQSELRALFDNHGHYYDSDCGLDFGCECGAVDDYDNSDIKHADHLTAVLLDSPVIRRIQAEAFFEGVQHQWTHRPIGNRSPHNPYRKEQS